MRAKVSFGYLYDFRNPPPWARRWEDVYAETLDFIAWSESAGFEGAWVPEHHGAEDGYLPSPMIALAAIAARTSRMRIGSAIALAPLYHPLRFAEDAVVLDILSEGRLEMALAIGYRRSETAAYGVEFGKRGARFDEFLEVVRRLWAGEAVTFEGRHYNLKDARIRPLSPRGQVTLHIGGFADNAMARVAKYAEGYFGNEEVCGLYIDKLREQGKDPASARILLQALFVTVAADPRSAMEELAPYFHYVNNVYGTWMAEDGAIGLDGAKLAPMTLDAFKTSGTLQILTPGQAIDRFRGMKERMPALEHLMLMLPPGLPPASFRPYAELFAREVIPAFR